MSVNAVIALCSWLILLARPFDGSQPPKTLVKGSHDFFTTDNLGNIYMINQEELVKFLPNGRQWARYSNLRLGTISSVDATNPLKILVYYHDFQQIVFLDNQLSVNSEVVSLEKLGYEQTALVCAGSNNSFWIYSRQNNELIRFDQNSRKIASTGNLKQIFRADIDPDFMLEHNNSLYLNTPNSGIYVFDIFGSFSRIISLPGLKNFQVAEDLVYYQSDSALCSYNFVQMDLRCSTKGIPAGTRAIRYFNKKRYFDFRDSVAVSEGD